MATQGRPPSRPPPPNMRPPVPGMRPAAFGQPGPPPAMAPPPVPASPAGSRNRFINEVIIIKVFNSYSYFFPWIP